MNCRAFDGLGHFVQLVNQGRSGFFDATLDHHRIGTCGHTLEPVPVGRLRQDRGSRWTIPDHVQGLGCDCADNLYTEALELVPELDLLDYTEAIWVTFGLPNSYSNTTLRFYCPSVTLPVSASLLMPVRIALLKTSPQVLLFAAILRFTNFQQCGKNDHHFVFRYIPGWGR